MQSDLFISTNRLSRMSHDYFPLAHLKTLTLDFQLLALIVLTCCVQATGAVLAHLTDEKRKHTHVLWVNLQEELVLEGNGQIFAVREPTCLDQHISIPSSDPELLEVERKLFFFCLFKCFSWLLY